MPVFDQVGGRTCGYHGSTKEENKISSNETIFSMSLSFQKDEDGLSHSIEMPKVPPPEELKDETYLKICSINQHAVFYGMKYTLPSMLKAGIGSIVNISSIAGIVAIYGYPNLAYMASKFAVRGMTKATAVEYADKNIRANSVHPGFIKTPMMAEATDEEGGDATSIIPLGRLAQSEEVSNLVIFLASDESSYMTGTEQIIDGGMSVR